MPPDTALIPAPADLHPLIALIANSVPSPHSKRAYSCAIARFLTWAQEDPRRQFTRATVHEYRSKLETEEKRTQTITSAMVAIRALAREARDAGILDPWVAQGIVEVKSPQNLGKRKGNWLTMKQARELLAIPNQNTVRGARDFVVLGLMIGTGMRLEEISRLNIEDLRKREGRMCIVDMVGKGRRVRTIPVARWLEDGILRWLVAAKLERTGPLIRRLYVNRDINEDRSWFVMPWQDPDNVPPKCLYDIVRKAANKAGFHDISPHDLRRTFARLCMKRDGRLEQIQAVLGHSSIRTTSLYIGIDLDLDKPITDCISMGGQGD